MYTGFKVNTSINKSVTSGMNETQLESLQREVDTYTRKLEQEKRKYFTVQDNYKVVLDEYEREKGRLNQLKKENGKAHNVIMQAKIKNLEANLDNAISTFDDTVAHNKRLKGDIDMLRREKKNYLEMNHSLEEQIGKLELESTQKVQLIESKKRRAEQLKNQIMQIKLKNEDERDNYMKQFDSLEKDYLREKREREQGKVLDSRQKPETIDTQPLLLFRLKKILAANKEKMKMIDQYKRHMKAIEEAFNDIKLHSGISDLDEITSTFIKSEEQNYSLYNYMDMLSQNIDSLQDSNLELEDRIARQLQENEEKRQMMSDTPEEEKKKQELEAYVHKKEEASRELRELIELVKPSLQSTLMELARSNFNDDPRKLLNYELEMDINERNIEQYLSDLQKYINTLLVARQQAKTKVITNKKEVVTNYTRQPPAVHGDDIKQRADFREENKFLEDGRFREYAADYWDKRKNRGRD